MGWADEGIRPYDSLECFYIENNFYTVLYFLFSHMVLLLLSGALRILRICCTARTKRHIGHSHTSESGIQRLRGERIEKTYKYSSLFSFSFRY